MLGGAELAEIQSRDREVADRRPAPCSCSICVAPADRRALLAHARAMEAGLKDPNVVWVSYLRGGICLPWDAIREELRRKGEMPLSPTCAHPDDLPEAIEARAVVLINDTIGSGDADTVGARIRELATRAAHLEALCDHLKHCLDHWADRPEVIKMAGDRDKAVHDLIRFQDEVWGILDGLMKRLGAGIGGHQAEAWQFIDHALDVRDRLLQLFGAPSQAMIDVAGERRRHVAVEGWSPEHDDQHEDGSMARAAASYAYVAGISDRRRGSVSGIFSLGNNYIIRDIWPWAHQWWKPKDRYTDLKRAAALCIAEMERLLRKEARNG